MSSTNKVSQFVQSDNLVNGELTLPRGVESVSADAIYVGAGGKLVVPNESLNADIDDGEEIDSIEILAKIRKPYRLEWIALKRDSELITQMLLHKPHPAAIETDYYFIDEPLRGPIKDELKKLRVFLFYSLPARTFGFWAINIALSNSWYESVATLLKRSPEFFAQNAVRVYSDRANQVYRAKSKTLSIDVAWPAKTTGELLGEALGPDRFIRSAEHPIYRQLVEGADLT